MPPKNANTHMSVYDIFIVSTEFLIIPHHFQELPSFYFYPVPCNVVQPLSFFFSLYYSLILHSLQGAKLNINQNKNIGQKLWAFTTLKGLVLLLSF